MADARSLGLGARRGFDLGLDSILSGPRLIRDMYASALPALGRFGAAFAQGDAPEAPPESSPSSSPGRGALLQGGAKPAVKPWDENATRTMLGGLESVTDSVREHLPYLRYDVSGGLPGLKDYAPGGEVKERLPGAKGGGTVSMMTAPENADRVTFPSQMEDLQMKEMLGDPLGIRRSEHEARMKQNPVDVRRGDILDGLAELEQGLAERVQSGQMSPEDAQARLAEGRKRAQGFMDMLKSGFPQPGMEDLPPISGPVG